MLSRFLFAFDSCVSIYNSSINVFAGTCSLWRAVQPAVWGCNWRAVGLCELIRATVSATGSQCLDVADWRCGLDFLKHAGQFIRQLAVSGMRQLSDASVSGQLGMLAKMICLILGAVGCWVNCNAGGGCSPCSLRQFEIDSWSTRAIPGNWGGVRRLTAGLLLPMTTDEHLTHSSRVNDHRLLC
jgi:hypothetical protein